MSVREKLKSMGLELPVAAKPLAAYVPAVKTGNIVFTAGQLPLVDGKIPHIGKVGKDVTQEDAKEMAKICALNAMAALNLVDDVDNVQASDLAGVLSCFTTDVVEVVGHGNHRVGDWPDHFLSVLLHLFQDECRNEFGGQAFVLVDNEVVLVAHLTLDGFDDGTGVGNRNAFEGGTDHDLVFIQQHDGGGNCPTIGIGDHGGVAIFVQHGDSTERGAKVNSDRISFEKLHFSFNSCA